MKKVYITRFQQEELGAKIREALAWVGCQDIITPNTRVFIKPNLTWESPTPGVTVTPAFLRALVENLLPLTQHITIGESEGGQACFLAEKAFQSHGLYDLAGDYGIKVVNLSKMPHEQVATTIAGKRVALQLPSLLLREVDCFVTVPVPKIHAMTGVSLGFKNQWGCLGDEMRVNQHPYFNRAVLAIHQFLQPRLCLFDGTYFLDHTGPLFGKPVPMNLIIAGNDIGAASLACCEIMQIDPLSIPHLRLANKIGLLQKSRHGIEFNRLPQEFVKQRFRLRRTLINYIHLAAFKSLLLNRIFYDSIFADPLHEFLWFIRRHPLISRLLYGIMGPGQANRHGGICKSNRK